LKRPGGVSPPALLHPGGVKLQTNEVAYIGVGGTLLGVILGMIGTYCFSLRLARKNNRIAAGAKLRAAFAPIIAEYNSRLIKGDFYLCSDNFFENALINQRTAIEEYRWFVPPERQRAYQQAWEDYHFKYGGLYFTDYIVGDNRQKLFKQRIDAILRFTKE
jgi:hypothetical protein